jgi:hypothetical protein
VKIKIKPIENQVRINHDELRIISENRRSDRIGGYPISLAEEEPQYLLGMPVYQGLPFMGRLPMIIPIGQHRLAIKILKEIPTEKVMLKRLISEYRAVVKALLRMGIDFKIMNLMDGEKTVRRWLLKKGCEGVEFPKEKPTHWHVFPRDMFVYLEEIRTILVHSRLFHIRKDRSSVCDIIHTELAEGGKILFSGDHLITGCHPEAIHRRGGNKVLNELKEKGMRITLIPHAIFFALSREMKGKPISTYYESHIDRSASLLRGKDGDYYLVLDPYYRTGPLAAPLSVQKSIDLVRKICEKNGIEVRVPASLSVPYGTSAVQCDDEKVLVTGGEEEILSTFADIVEGRNLYITEISLSAYPVFAGAGLHCLIAERPIPLI